MGQSVRQKFFLGDWQVEPSNNRLTLGKIKRSIEPKSMDVLLLLCQKNNEVVSADEIVSQCWPDSPTGDNPVHKAITHLRRALNDKATAPQYIETVRKRGYRIIADVQFLVNDTDNAVASTWTEHPPFVGLNAFTAKESEIFFGRDALIRDIVSHKAELFRKKRPFSLILGPSGCGKSSLIHAGVLPLFLRNKGLNSIYAHDFASIDVADIESSNNEFAIFVELASYMIDWGDENSYVFNNLSATELAELLLNEADKVIAIVSDWLVERDQGVNFPCFAIIIDRLEAYLADQSIPTSSKSRFFSILEQLSQSNLFLTFLISRNDFYPLISTFETLMKNKGKGAHIDVTPPSLNELSQIIKRPAVAANIAWELDENTNSRLDDIILSDASRAPNCLPLLQYTLQELYLQRANNKLCVKTYNELGGIEGAIGHKAEQLYESLSEAVKNALDNILPLIVNVTQSGNTLTSKTAHWDTLQTQDERELVKQMVEHRLFVSFSNKGKASFKVAHEAVLRKWERVQKWVETHHNSLILKARLAEQTSQWLVNNKNYAFLLSEGKPFFDAIMLTSLANIRLEESEKEFIAHSQKRISRRKVLKGVTAATLVVLLVVSSIATIYSQQARELAENKRKEAEDLMGFMIGDFADKLRTVKRMDLLEGISEQALQYVERAKQTQNSTLFNTQSASFELRFQHALSVQAMAEVKFYRDEIDTAKEAYDEASIRLEELLKEQQTNQQLLKAYGANQFWLGQIHYINGAMSDSKKYFDSYLSTSEAMLAAAPNSLEAMMEVSYAENSVGTIAFEQFDFENAIKHYQASLEYKEKVVEADPSNTEALLYSADTRSWLASMVLHLGEFESAERYYREGASQLQLLYEQDGENAAVMQTYVALLTKQATLLLMRNNDEQALHSIDKAKYLIEKALQQDPKNTEWIGDDVYIKTLKHVYFYTQDVEEETSKLISLVSDKKEYRSISTLIRFLQSKDSWKHAGELINQLETLKPELQSQEPVSDFYSLQSRNEYLTLKINQELHDDSEQIERLCAHLSSLNDSVANKSQHYSILYAQHVASICLNSENPPYSKIDEMRKFYTHLLQ